MLWCILELPLLLVQLYTGRDANFKFRKIIIGSVVNCNLKFKALGILNRPISVKAVLNPHHQTRYKPADALNFHKQGKRAFLREGRRYHGIREICFYRICYSVNHFCGKRMVQHCTEHFLGNNCLYKLSWLYTMLNFESTYLRVQSIVLLQWRDTSTLNSIILFNRQIFNTLKSR